MKRWTRICLALMVSLLLPLAAVAQEEDYYLDEEIEDGEGRYALGLGFGLVELGDNVEQGGRLLIDDTVEQYWALNLRIAVGPGHDRRGSDLRGYLEPELGYWSGDFTDDLLLGINIIGVMPLRAVEFFVGGGIGIHFVDRDLAPSTRLISNLEDSDEALGVNAQFGADVKLSRKTSLFAVGRFDVVDDDRDELEGKAYIGLRFRFGGGGDDD